MSRMLGDIAVTAVYKLLSNNLGLSSLYIYKYEKEEKIGGSYIVINHLPFVHKNDVEEGRLNINIHVPKLRTGLPNTKELQRILKAVLNLLPEDTDLEGAYYEFYSDSRPTPDDDDTYYINLQVNVFYNNLNY